MQRAMGEDGVRSIALGTFALILLVSAWPAGSVLSGNQNNPRSPGQQQGSIPEASDIIRRINA